MPTENQGGIENMSIKIIRNPNLGERTLEVATHHLRASDSFPAQLPSALQNWV
jgi:hypothetical protein